MALASCSQRECTVTEQAVVVSVDDARSQADRDAGTLADGSACQAACARMLDYTVSCAEEQLLSCSGAVAPFTCQVRFTDCYTPGEPVCGRRPEGWRDPGSDLADPLAAWWARQMRLEHASVAAFARLADELTAHRAPAPLVALARRSRRDEVRHTRAMAAFVRRAGAPAARAVGSSPVAERSLAAMADENAVEGCVREAFGALLAAWQAKHARDPLARSAFAVIARDEARHAGLAWRVHGWASGRLSKRERAELDGAMRAALATLAGEIEAEPVAGLREAGLWPDRRALRAALATLAGEVSPARLRPPGDHVPPRALAVEVHLRPRRSSRCAR